MVVVVGGGGGGGINRTEGRTQASDVYTVAITVGTSPQREDTERERGDTVNTKHTSNSKCHLSVHK